ncbi:WEB family protein [Sesbania bispinosa]|nr:WEB family protein [Sesbania bispinosa]
MSKVEEDRGRIFNELREMKKVAEETNVMVDEAIATKRISVSEPQAGLNSSNQSKLNKTEQMGVKDNGNIESSKHESKKGLELEKDALLDKLRKEMDSLRSSEANAMALLSDYKRKVQELEVELDKRKESEANLFDTLVMQTKQLEQHKILLEESKLEISSLDEKIKAIQGGTTQTIKIPDESQDGVEDGLSTKEDEKGMKIEEEVVKKELNGNGIQEGDGLSMKAKTLLEELDLLKTELKSATQAEENSKKAMDDLAFALKEVATEASQVKAKLTLSQVELENTKGEAERWKLMLERTEEKYKELLDVKRKEADKYKNTTERLRMEAEESLLAWNGKETQFVNCIKRTEDERLLAHKESSRLLELLTEAENKIKVSKEENQKLRDILKQALNESNVAKEAAEIAKAENARLQDSLNLKFDDVEKSSSKEGSKEDKESVKKAKGHNSVDKEHRDSKNLNKTFSFNLKEMISPHNHKQQQHKVGNEEANRETDDDTLKGSIFDEVDSSDSESQIGIPDDFDHLDESHFDDSEGDRNNRKRRALLRRFGDLIRRRNNHHFHRKEPSNIEEHLQT